MNLPNLTKHPDLESFIGYYPNFVTVPMDVLIPALEADLNTLLDKVSR